MHVFECITCICATIANFIFYVFKVLTCEVIFYTKCKVRKYAKTCVWKNECLYVYLGNSKYKLHLYPKNCRTLQFPQNRVEVYDFLCRHFHLSSCKCSCVLCEQNVTSAGNSLQIRSSGTLRFRKTSFYKQDCRSLSEIIHLLAQQRNIL